MQTLFIKPLNPEYEKRILRNPSLNVDSFILPSPFAADSSLRKDYKHSLVWEEEREILGYMEVWSTPDRDRLHIYRQVTSPFGRGKGIGSAFISYLAEHAPKDAIIDLYVWERQAETLSFYKKRGFNEVERIAWRALSFILVRGNPAYIIKRSGETSFAQGASEDLSRVRHDAKKAIKVLGDMAGALSAENCSRIIEDINRESTALLNTLNLFRDSVQRFQTVNLRDVIVDRIIPLVDHSPMGCALTLRLGPELSEVRANYLEAGRAMVNLVSNALDAIRASGRKGLLDISLDREEHQMLLTITDNGVGIAADRLELDDNGYYQFVGITTKGEEGEGQGTRQIFRTFGKENIQVTSEKGLWTRWEIRIPMARGSDEMELSNLESRWAEFTSLHVSVELDKDSPNEKIAAFIWRLRKLEILIWDLILQFARKNNVRELYRSFLSVRNGSFNIDVFKADLDKARIDYPELKDMLYGAVERFIEKNDFLQSLKLDESWDEVLFFSYSQAIKRTVIFTLNPETGAFGASDRKLAEHADFVAWLGEKRDILLRGEFFGDLRDTHNPVQLGVWETSNLEATIEKAALVRAGAKRLMRMGLSPDKKLIFYETTWRREGYDLDVNHPSNLQLVADLPDIQLRNLIVYVGKDEAQDYIFSD